MEENKKPTNKKMTLVIVIAIVLIGAAFYFGDKHGQSTAAANSRAQFAASGLTGGAAGRTRFAGGGAVIGTVLDKDDTSFTVKSSDGSSKIVLYSDSTQVSKTTAGTMDDVAVGSTVMVTGMQNSDGSVTARSVQIRPLMAEGSAGGAAGGTTGNGGTSASAGSAPAGATQ